MTDFAAFGENFNAGRSQVVSRWLAADLDTPVSAWLKLCRGESHAMLLESVEGGAVLGRYSAIALRPDFFWRYDGATSAISADAQNWTVAAEKPLDHLKAQIKDCRIDDVPDDLPPMAAGGLFGYLGYDMVRLIENIPDKNPDTLGIPQGLLMRPQVMVIFDNVRHMLLISVPVRAHKDNAGLSPRATYDAAMMKLDEAQAALHAPYDPQKDRHTTNLQTPLPVTPNVTRGQYHDMVRQGVEYIHAGEIFQVVPSQRFRIPFDLPSFDLYRSLRRVNPSPFLFHLKMGDFALVGSSPEILVRVRRNRITIRPIAGTRKRGANAAEDKALAEDLLNDPKERSEHLMLLDLGRNDVGRAASIGSVRVTDRFIIEYYSHVMHIVSNVEGDLHPEKDSLDALFAGFPAGTVSGAPKIRAMEIIDELEPEKRGFYGGCVGYFNGSGDVDTCIALRTALVKDGEIIVQAGAGVVADSDPEFEYQECLNKARALIHAAEMAIEEAKQEPRMDTNKHE
jgi:anthranilate synthase component 1